MESSYLTQRAISWWTKAQDLTIFAIPPQHFPNSTFFNAEISICISVITGRKMLGIFISPLKQSTKHDFMVLKARIIDLSLLVRSNLFEMQLTVNQHQEKEEEKGQYSWQTEPS